MSTNTARRIAATTGAVAAALTLVATGSAAADIPTEQETMADLDGDRAPERVTVRMSTADNQVLTATVDGQPLTATTTADLPGGVPPLRVTDIDGDGRDEVLVTEVSGANTVWLSIWHYRAGDLVRVGTDDGHQLTLYEGGGVAARSGYACGDDALAVLSAEADDGATDPITYSGSRTSYELRAGVATQTDRISFHHATTDQAIMRTDPDSCAS